MQHHSYCICYLLVRPLIDIEFKLLVEVWRTAFWMKHWGHPNFKRTKLWSTSWAVWRLSRGKLDTKKEKNLTKTVRKYVSKSGKAGYTGTGDLKKSQCFGCLCNVFCLETCVFTSFS